MNTEHELLLAKRDATLRRYDRTGQRSFLAEFFEISNAAEEKIEMARCAFMHNKINDVLDSNKNFWKELRNLGLLPGNSDAVHGFMTDELNDHFAGISISSHEDLQGMQQQLQNALLFNASMALKARLQRLSNTGVRYIFCIFRDTRIAPYRSQLGWLRADSRRKYFALLVNVQGGSYEGA